MSEEMNEVEAAEEKAPKTAKKVTGISKDASLKVLADANPKRPGSASYDRFEGYFKDGVETVQDALDNGLTMGDIKYDIVHEFVEVDGAEVEEYTPSKRGPRGPNEASEAAPADLLDEGEDGAEGNDALFG